MDPSDAIDSIILVACCGPKLPEPAPAADLYVSSLFKKARTYAERRGRWFILSALHGLLNPTKEIAPYDVTLKKLPAQKRREWGQMVRTQMESAGLIGLSLGGAGGGGLCEAPDRRRPDRGTADEGEKHRQATSMAQQGERLILSVKSSPGTASAPVGSFPSTTR